MQLSVPILFYGMSNIPLNWPMHLDPILVCQPYGVGKLEKQLQIQNHLKK